MKNVTKLLLLCVSVCISITGFANIPRLSSHPSATATIFLDFDGHRVTSAVWNGGVPVNCAPSGLTDLQITEIFNRVSEDYRPFNINITTDSMVFLAAPLIQRVRVIVTPTSAWRPGVGGIAYIGSFTWGDDTPAFVFSDRLGPNSPKYIAECCTHESGHTLGLSHQSTYDNSCNLVETYNTGTGSGETGWAPVMGNSYYKNMTGWNDGPTPYGCATLQDNLTTITSINGFTYRTDDFTDILDDNTYAIGSNAFSVDGLISTSTDKDAFRFVATQNISFFLEAKPFSIGGNNIGANLDVKVSMYDGNKNLIRVYDPETTMAVSIDTTLNSGTYYFVVDGSGNQNTSNYGSLGSYKITGFLGSLPIRDVSLQGRVEKNKHILQWKIIADEAISVQELQVSTDGSTFKPLATVTPGLLNYQYQPVQQGTLYYRLKVVSVINQVAYSSIIALKNNNAPEKFATISTFVHNEIQIQSLEQFRYRLMDANGRMMQVGTGNNGMNRIAADRLPSGMYILQLFNNNQIQTERIIKQ